jgi:hypothetical protein
MTQPQSTISEIDFKLRLIAHFLKVHGKCDKFQSTQNLMIDQTIRTDHEIVLMIGENSKLNIKVKKLAVKYGITGWVRECRDLRSPDRNPSRGEVDV